MFGRFKLFRSLHRGYHFNLLNLKVGFTKLVELHPNSDKLYISRVDLGSGISKQICSGLQQHIPSKDLKDQLVIVVDNMKKCKLRGEVSESMLLCGEDTSNSLVQLCKPAKFGLEMIGKQVFLSGQDDTMEAATRKIKPVEWEDIASRLKIDANQNVTYTDEETGQKQTLMVKLNGEQIPIIVSGLPEGSPVR